MPLLINKSLRFLIYLTSFSKCEKVLYLNIKIFHDSYPALCHVPGARPGAGQILQELQEFLRLLSRQGTFLCSLNTDKKNIFMCVKIESKNQNQDFPNCAAQFVPILFVNFVRPLT